MDVLVDPCLSWSDKAGLKVSGGIAHLLEALFQHRVGEIRVPADVVGGVWSRVFSLAMAVTLISGRDCIETLDAVEIAAVLRDRAEREGGVGMGDKAFRLVAPYDEVAFLQLAITSDSAVGERALFALKSIPDHTANFRQSADLLPIDVALAAFLGYISRPWSGGPDQFKGINQAPVQVYVLPGGDIGARLLREIDMTLEFAKADTKPMFGWLGAWPSEHTETKSAADFHSFALVTNDPIRLFANDGQIWAERAAPTKVEKRNATAVSDGEEAEDEDMSNENSPPKGPKKVNVRYINDVTATFPYPWAALVSSRPSKAQEWGPQKVSSPGSLREFSTSDVMALLDSAVDGVIENKNGVRRFVASRHLTSRLLVPADSQLVIEGFHFDPKGQKVLHPIAVRLALPNTAFDDSIWATIRETTREMIQYADGERSKLHVKAFKYFETHRLVGTVGGQKFAEHKTELGKNAKKDVKAKVEGISNAFGHEVDTVFFHELGFAIGGEMGVWKARLKTISKIIFNDFCADRSNETAHLIARGTVNGGIYMDEAQKLDESEKTKITPNAIRKLVGDVLRLSSGDLAALRREHSDERFSKVGMVCGLIGDAKNAVEADGGYRISFHHAYTLCVFMARIGRQGLIHPAQALRDIEYSRFDDLVCARGDRMPEMLARTARLLRSKQAKIDPYPVYRLIVENMSDSDSEAMKIEWMRVFYASKSPPKSNVADAA